MSCLRTDNLRLLKDEQVGRWGKKGRQKERNAVFKAQKEDELLGMALDYLEDIEATYFRILEDGEWNWTSWNAPKELKKLLSDNFAGWADLFIMRPKDRFNSLCLIELKRKGRKMRKSQTKRARDVNVIVCTDIQHFMCVVNKFLGIEYNDR